MKCPLQPEKPVFRGEAPHLYLLPQTLLWCWELCVTTITQPGLAGGDTQNPPKSEKVFKKPVRPLFVLGLARLGCGDHSIGVAPNTMQPDRAGRRVIWDLGKHGCVLRIVAANGGGSLLLIYVGYYMYFRWRLCGTGWRQCLSMLLRLTLSVLEPVTLFPICDGGEATD